MHTATRIIDDNIVHIMWDTNDLIAKQNGLDKCFKIRHCFNDKDGNPKERFFNIFTTSRKMADDLMDYWNHFNKTSPLIHRYNIVED